MPDTQMNVGPLPSTSGGPAGSNGDPDGKINFNSSLLSGITPYAYGDAARMGSDRNYQQIPHRMQYIIERLHLPHADHRVHDLVPMSHSVDMGDVAFLIGTRRVQGVLFDRTAQFDGAIAHSKLPARNAFCNLATVNYILAGLQRIDAGRHGNSPWVRLARDLDFDHTDPCKRGAEIIRLLRTGLVPYGICAGSENQGGKHETGLAPVQAAVNHVTTMTIDGQNRDLVNFWRRCNLDAGDQLIFRLEYLETRHFTLNHYYKGIVHQTFSEARPCWQVVPDVFRMAYDPERYDGLPRLRNPDMEYDYRLHGYWRIGQMFHHRGKMDVPVENYSNDTIFLRGQLLHITFAPVWRQESTDLCTPLAVPLGKRWRGSGKGGGGGHGGDGGDGGDGGGGGGGGGGEDGKGKPKRRVLIKSSNFGGGTLGGPILERPPASDFPSEVRDLETLNTWYANADHSLATMYENAMLRGEDESKLFGGKTLDQAREELFRRYLILQQQMSANQQSAHGEDQGHQNPGDAAESQKDKSTLKRIPDETFPVEEGAESPDDNFVIAPIIHRGHKHGITDGLHEKVRRVLKGQSEARIAEKHKKDSSKETSKSPTKSTTPTAGVAMPNAITSGAPAPKKLKITSEAAATGAKKAKKAKEDKMEEDLNV